ncbi:AAA family ATPase [Campylobacter sp. IFREMER_LSEM_CL292]|uniref:DUF4435 domain-containing protein n=1 Tax=Campylobacter sp. IFREMER_LSEM_CL292 TaxID=2911623 RepID=UPI0021E71905|nr:DUF4435 domain-containing protein [Campylobacter sp. IFREMER_LSEM_CL292]MCV3383480.1 AAA family ATPase [Campylobacter sp. IFREMER_LSEM_CL292]HEC1786109.1 AAA family ATPase [Campylobacter lari]
MEEYIYYLPDENGDKKEFKTNANSIIIVGANGSGKSRLGAWMKNNENIHIIASKRLYYIDEKIEYVYSDASDSNNLEIKDIQDDYTTVISNLFFKQFREILLRNKEEPITTCVDYLFDIFKETTQKELGINHDNKFYIKHKDYEIINFSRGEELILYSIAKILTIPIKDNKQQTIIIDEPELHLHPSLTNRLWSVLEKHRQDCLFIYITHDLNFAANHIEADKFWIKSYNGQKWEIEKIEKNDIPQELFLKLLGARRDILFVEGKSESLDTKIYSILYPQYQIIPCSSCENVLNYTKTFNEQNALHGFNAYGIIDRDFRTQEEIDSANKNQVKVLEVAEVENLFLLECIILAILEQSDAREKFEEVKDYIFETKFKNVLQNQISEKLEKEVKHKLKSIFKESKTPKQIQEKISSLEQLIGFENLHKDIENKFNSVYESKDYDELLKIFNQKGILENGVFLSKVGKTKDTYAKSVLKLLRENEELRKEVLKYIPSFTE